MRAVHEASSVTISDSSVGLHRAHKLEGKLSLAAPRLAFRPLGDQLRLKFHHLLLFLWSCPVKSYSSGDVWVFMWGHAAGGGVCKGAPRPGPARCSCAADASSDSVTRESPPHVSDRHSSPSPVVLFLFWHVGDARMITKCRTAASGPQGTMEFWGCHCDPEGVWWSCGAEWWVCRMWSLVTLNSAFVVWQPPGTGCKCMVWLGFRKTLWNSKNFHKSWNTVLLTPLS